MFRGFLYVIVVSLIYNIKYPVATVVVIWCCIKKMKWTELHANDIQSHCTVKRVIGIKAKYFSKENK